MLMSKSAKGAAAAKLVQDATAAQGVYVFAQLLEVPNVKEVCNCFETHFDEYRISSFCMSAPEPA